MKVFRKERIWGTVKYLLICYRDDFAEENYR